MKKKKLSFVSSLIFILLGIIVFVKPDIVVKFTSYVLGGLLIALGIYKCVNYYIKDKNLKVVNYNELAFGISSIVLGILFIFLASTIELLFRIVIGIWLILKGISSIFQTFYITNRDKAFYSLIVIGLIYIGIGLYIVLESNLVLSIIGLFMIIYGIIDLISYFVYKDKFEYKAKYKEVIEEVEYIETKETKKGNKK